VRARQFNSVVILKGAHTLVGCPDGSVFVNMSGNPGMAKAGTGDVLNGVIAAMHGLGLAIPNRPAWGVHPRLAGDIAAEEFGETGYPQQK